MKKFLEHLSAVEAITLRVTGVLLLLILCAMLIASELKHLLD